MILVYDVRKAQESYLHISGGVFLFVLFGVVLCVFGLFSFLNIQKCTNKRQCGNKMYYNFYKNLQLRN